MSEKKETGKQPEEKKNWFYYLWRTAAEWSWDILTGGLPDLPEKKKKKK